MRTLLLLTMLLAPVVLAEARPRRHTTCCIMVPTAEGGERPYCFILNVRPARYGRKVCRRIGGKPQRPTAATWR
jgi:hypothetical protein